ncbi:MAG: BrnA antitoxin family protein [Nitrospira sp.]|nr:BrnA antitoxin family protein [Nitrospira sp.]MBS0193113.1 BrnA antitoxin family protein [Pseudomonadota bacterium]MBS0193992.1 BrnA antitoxin family protein [Pseudomonadota bacterium]
MNEKHTTVRTQKVDVPYDPKSKTATLKFWDGAVAHKGVAELRAKRGRPAKAIADRKEQIALRVDKDVLEWYRAQGNGWQTRMNAVLKAFRDATA